MTPEETENDINIQENGFDIVPTLAEVLTRDNDGGGVGIFNISALNMSASPASNFILMHSPDGSPWRVTVNDSGVLVVTSDV